MAFNPKTEYDIVPGQTDIRDFYAYKEEYIARPPYQRKNVWSNKKKQALLDSLIRRYYVPKLVIREVRLGEDRTVNEVIDGQQRITAVQEFFGNRLRLPKSLSDISEELPGKYYEDLNNEMKRFLDKRIRYELDLIKNIDDRKNPEHQKIATEIFWRLQQGESLNFMEIAHAKLTSLTRNFIVKYSDDISFDYDLYQPKDSNPDKHPFFNIIDRGNNRMQHLMIMARLTMIEEEDGYVDLKDTALTEFIESHERADGIGNISYEETSTAKNVIGNLDFIYRIFADDPSVDEDNGIKELKREYVIISFYMLIRHLRNYYVINATLKKEIVNFFYKFHERWSRRENEDSDILNFSSNRQQSKNNLEIRDMILRQLFFDYCRENNVQVIAKDGQRIFDEDQRIRIYRRDKGICQMCLEEGKPEKEASVSWSEYQADHVIPHSLGGRTEIDNAQVFCRYHNQKKSNKIIPSHE